MGEAACDGNRLPEAQELERVRSALTSTYDYVIPRGGVTRLAGERLKS